MKFKVENTYISAVIVIGFLLSSSTSHSSCGIDVPALELRVKDADAIFVGVVKSDEPVQTKDEIDSEAFLEVKKVYKGDVPDFVILQYIKGGSGDCMDNILRLNSDSKEEVLFFAKKRGDKYFSSLKMGVEVADVARARDDISKLPDVISKTSRPWWNVFGWF